MDQRVAFPQNIPANHPSLQELGPAVPLQQFMTIIDCPALLQARSALLDSERIQIHHPQPRS